ncbi:MAG TPA: hypothetical protein VJ746_08385 [Nitrospira sp.]|nr:hypothetical protein [Nitrospira sp.]
MHQSFGAALSAFCAAAWLCVGEPASFSNTVEREDPQVALETVPATQTVTGTLSMLDLSVGKGMLKTDMDKPIFFRIGHPEQFSHLSIGDRITMQLDEEGRVVKVIEALPSEVHEPLPPAQ